MNSRAYTGPGIGVRPRAVRRGVLLAMLAMIALASRPVAAAEERVPLIASNLTVLVEQGQGEMDAAGSYTLRVYRREPGSLAPLEFVAGELRPRDGVIERTWLRDLDGDGTWEILIWIVGSRDEHYGTLESFRLAGNRLRAAKFPGLSDREDHGYAGRDVYRVLDNLVEREFPLYREAPEGLLPTGQRRLLRYQVVGGRWKKIGDETRDAAGQVVK